MARLAYCGNDCKVCPRFLATKSKNIRQLREVADIWRRAGWRNSEVILEEIVCDGCTPESPCRYGIAACAAARNIATCGDCKKYPCFRLEKACARSQEYAVKCKELFDEETFQQLERAFFKKQTNLESNRE